ncbi:MAG: hypothetical protein HW391_790 [Chloroflexi bacterium]|nr:hypothetical protein [Chloroflexota bacterium]
MRELVNEVLLRFIKVGAATLVGAIIFLAAVGPFGATPGVELWLLCWLAGAATILLLDSSPI